MYSVELPVIAPEVRKNGPYNAIPMLTALQECEWFTFNPSTASTPSLSPLLLLPNLKSDPEHSDIPQNLGYLESHESLEETAPECSDSDCSSNSCDGASLELFTNLFSTVPQPSVPEDVSLFDWEDIWTQTIEEGNALGLYFTPEIVSLEDQAVATSTPEAESLRAPPHHQDARSSGCTYQEHQAFQHLAPPSDSRADETLAGEGQQDICLGADVSDASGLEVSTHNREAVPVDEKSTSQQIQGLCKPLGQRADTYPESGKPHRDGLEDYLSARYPGQREGAAAAKGLSLYAWNSHPNEWEFLRTPPMRPVQLPGEEEAGDCLLYSGPDLGGWLNGTMGGVALKPPRRRFASAVV